MNADQPINCYLSYGRRLMKCGSVQIGQLVSAKTLLLLACGRELYLKDRVSGISRMAGATVGPRTSN